MAAGLPHPRADEFPQILKLGGGKKYKVLMDSSAAPGLITDVLFFDSKFIAKHPDTVRAVMRGYLDGLPAGKVRAFETGLLSSLRDSGADILADIREQKALSPELEERLHAFIKDYKKVFV